MRLARSAPAKRGAAKMRSYWTGTSIAWVTRWRSTASRNPSAENLGKSTLVPPRAVVMNQVTVVVFE